MTVAGKIQRRCALSGVEVEEADLTSIGLLRPKLAEFILQRHPSLTEESGISAGVLNGFRAEYVRDLLESELGELSALEEDVVRSLHDQELITERGDLEAETELTFGEKLSDRMASFGGSWKFIMGFGGMLVVWIIVNSVMLATRPFDRYPFILLNLILSCLAALQAPVIMMSQNRQEARDRRRAESDYKVNLKAELEIRHIDEKLDHLLKQNLQKLLDIQEVQLDVMREISASKQKPVSANSEGAVGG
ncbi:MAG: DUF1003 domain-containing protein [Akkermansiaceae bacterium]